MRYVNKLLLLPVLSLLIMGFYSCNVEQEKSEELAPNILFIPIDDLRPEFGAYRSGTIITPNIDRLAQQGVTFTRAYCQQAVCNPSRASLLTGLRPDTIQVWDLKTNFRQHLPDIVTLPQFFKEHGYTTIGLGKTFHNNIPDTISWTEKPHIDGFPFDPDAVYANEENLLIQNGKIEKMKKEGKSRIDQLGHWYVKANATENADVEDDFYFDGAQTTLAIEILQELASQKEPFFLSVGYYRPHLPFNAPKNIGISTTGMKFRWLKISSPQREAPPMLFMEMLSSADIPIAMSCLCPLKSHGMKHANGKSSMAIMLVSLTSMPR